MNSIAGVPEFVAQDFRVLPGHPSGKPGAYEKSVQRVYRLIAHALDGLPRADWLIDGETRYRSAILNEPLGLLRFADGFVVYGEERGRKRVLAVFKDDHLVAKYFVWLVSNGQREIDWSLFLDMEP